MGDFIILIGSGSVLVWIVEGRGRVAVRYGVFTVEPMAEVDEPVLLGAERIRLTARQSRFLFTALAGFGVRILRPGHGMGKSGATHCLKYSDPLPPATNLRLDANG